MREITSEKSFISRNGQRKTLSENPYAMTPATLPDEDEGACSTEPGGIRLSVGLEDWHDLIEDRQHALDHVSDLVSGDIHS